MRLPAIFKIGTFTYPLLKNVAMKITRMQIFWIFSGISNVVEYFGKRKNLSCQVEILRVCGYEN